MAKLPPVFPLALRVPSPSPASVPAAPVRITGRRVRADFNALESVLLYTRAAHRLGLWQSERLLIERFFPDRAAPLLEAGCGAGRATIALRELGYRDLTAFDFAAELLEQARSLAAARGAEAIRFLLADATRRADVLACLPVSPPHDATVSVQSTVHRPPSTAPRPPFAGALFLFNGLMQIPGRRARRRALRHLAAVVRPGGRLLFTTDDRDDPRELHLWRKEATRACTSSATATSSTNTAAPSCTCPTGPRSAPTLYLLVGYIPSTPSAARSPPNRPPCASSPTNAGSGWPPAPSEPAGRRAFAGLAAQPAARHAAPPMDLSLLTDRTSITLGTGFYAAGLLYGAGSLRYRHRHSRIAAYALILAGWALQTFGLYQRGQSVHSCPLGNKFELLQFIVWSCIVLYLVVGAAFRQSVLGFFSAGLAAVLGLVSLVIPAWDSARRAAAFGTGPAIAFHASLAVFSYGVFALLALPSLMYLLQLRHLQKKRLTGLYAYLPSIVELDQMNVRLLAFGVGLLTVALAVGRTQWSDNLAAIHLVSFAVWFAYAGVLVQRLRQRLVARSFARVCLFLFAATFLSLWPVSASRLPAPAPAATPAP